MSKITQNLDKELKDLKDQVKTTAFWSEVHLKELDKNENYTIAWFIFLAGAVFSLFFNLGASAIEILLAHWVGDKTNQYFFMQWVFLFAVGIVVIGLILSYIYLLRKGRKLRNDLTKDHATIIAINQQITKMEKLVSQAQANKNQKKT